MTPSAEPTSHAEAAAHLIPLGLIEGGEIVILALKPSGWFVFVSSLPVLGSAAVVAAVAYVVGLYHPSSYERVVWWACAAGALIRMVAAVWQWLGRTYVLTNRRIICIRGLVRVHWTAAALADVREVVLAPSIGERLVGTGSIFCLANPEGPPGLSWQTVSRPVEIHEIVLEAVHRARRGKAPPTRSQ